MADECERIGEAEAYVVGDLAGWELDDYARHLATCEICTQEVELVEAAAEAVPYLSAPAVNRERPRIDLTPSWPERAEYGADPAFTSPSPPREPARPRPQLRAISGGAAAAQSRPFMRRKGSKPTIAALVLIIVLGVVVNIIVRDRANAIARETHYVVGEAGWSGGGARISIDGSKGELLVKGMPPPLDGTHYELWVMDKGTTQVAPTSVYFIPSRGTKITPPGEAGIDIPGNIENVSVVAVYVQPIKGPQTTTGGAVVVANISSVTNLTKGH